MSDQKKGKLIVTGIGLIMILIAGLTIFVAAKTKHYTATIVEITDSKKKSSNGKRKYYEWVTVTYTDASGSERQAVNVRIKRSTESSLPKVGDNIEVKGKTSITEYNITSYIGTVIALIFVGIILVIRGLTYKPKAVSTEEPEAP